ncbi:MAG: NUDIX hydrolase [Candidatus Limnocylindrales bacterium]
MVGDRGIALAALDAAAALHASATNTLSDWRPAAPDQDALRLHYLAHLATHPDGCSRDGPPAHLTASCLVLDPSGRLTLLSLHRKGRFWVQFGGHLEAGDASLAHGARREGREESGIAMLELVHPEPIDVDRHRLSAAFGRCREHLDVGFLAVIPPDTLPATSAESDAVAWWPVKGLPTGTVPDLPKRLARAVAALTAASRTTRR